MEEKIRKYFFQVDVILQLPLNLEYTVAINILPECIIATTS